MKSINKYKQVAILLFVVFAILSIILLGLLTVQGKNNLFIYLVAVLIFICGLFMFILSTLGLSDKTLEDYCNDRKQAENAELEEFHRIENKAFEKDTNAPKEKEFDASSIVSRINAKLEDAKDIITYTETLMANISKEYELAQGLFYCKEKKKDNYKVCGKYAYYGDSEPEDFKLGETLPGQVAKNKELLAVSNIPDNYAVIVSGLGSGSPKYLLFTPFVMNSVSIGVMELAFFKTPDASIEIVLKELAGIIAEQVDKRIK